MDGISASSRGFVILARVESGQDFCLCYLQPLLGADSPRRKEFGASLARVSLCSQAALIWATLVSVVAPQRQWEVPGYSQSWDLCGGTGAQSENC